MLILVAMLNIKPFYLHGQPILTIKAKKKLGVKEGDHISLINIFNQFLQQNNRDHFCKLHNLNPREMEMAVKMQKSL